MPRCPIYIKEHTDDEMIGEVFTNQYDNQELIQLRDFLLPFLLNDHVKVE